MRISDWSSDVCSSDLRHPGLDHRLDHVGGEPFRHQFLDAVEIDVVQRLEIGKAEQAARLLGGAIDLDIELHRLSPPRKMPVSRLSRARSPASFALSPQRSKRQESSPQDRKSTRLNSSH